jgi:hypothetical protein
MIAMGIGHRELEIGAVPTGLAGCFFLVLRNSHFPNLHFRL